MDKVLADRIVSMRQVGYTWKQVDSMLYPNEPVQKRGLTYSGQYALKNKVAMADAFEKTVSGAYTATQVVTRKNR